MKQDESQDIELGVAAQSDVVILELLPEDLISVAGGPQIMNDDVVPP